MRSGMQGSRASLFPEGLVLSYGRLRCRERKATDRPRFQCHRDLSIDSAGCGNGRSGLRSSSRLASSASQRRRRCRPATPRPSPSRARPAGSGTCWGFTPLVRRVEKPLTPRRPERRQGFRRGLERRPKIQAATTSMCVKIPDVTGSGRQFERGGGFTRPTGTRKSMASFPRPVVFHRGFLVDSWKALNRCRSPIAARSAGDEPTDGGT